MSKPALAIDLDGVLGDTRALWRAWLESAVPVLGVDPDTLPLDRAKAADELDASGAGNWRTLLERFCEDRAPVYLRRDPATSAALRSLNGSGHRLGVFTDAPEPLAQVALAQLGAARRIELVVAGEDARERTLALLGPGAVVVTSRADLDRMVRGET
jgi:phosphoglycolate phosphatase-like HAD superfamily hydrolase